MSENITTEKLCQTSTNKNKTRERLLKNKLNEIQDQKNEMEQGKCDKGHILHTICLKL